ncbi:MAG: Secretion system C-terminal sorting domain, partial [Bacteroidota bacterium]
TNDWLYLSFSEPIQNGLLHFFDIRGTLLKKYDLSNSTDYYKINLSEWPQGIYGMVIQSEQETWHRKIVIQR